jgi:prophage regulatory protein
MNTVANSDATSVRLIPIAEVIRLTSRGRSKIYSDVRAGTFPQPIKDGSASRWVLGEIEGWIAARVAERNTKAAA